MSIRRQRRSKRRFIQLWSNVKRSAAYHGLSLPARCALIEILDRYTGINNGMIVLGVRELAEEMNCSHDTACRALHELDDAGLARPLKVGTWRGRKATEWRLTFYRCDATGELPVKVWPEYGRESAEVRPEKRKRVLSAARKAQTPKNSINAKSLSTAKEAHIDIYQEGTDSVSGAESVKDSGVAERQARCGRQDRHSGPKVVWRSGGG
jgi:hypothetical protein